MFRAFVKVQLPRSGNIFTSTTTLNLNIANQQFGTEKQKQQTTSKPSDHFCKHHQAFQNLQSHFKTNEPNKDVKKFDVKNSFEGLKQKLSENFSFGKDKKAGNMDSINESGQQDHGKIQNENIKVNTHLKEETISYQSVKINLREKLTELGTKGPVMGKVVDYIKESWEQTFPKDKFQVKTEEIRRKAKEAMERERENTINYTEEELEMMQGQIPNWKRTALVEIAGGAAETSRRGRIMTSIKTRVNRTSVAQQFYQSESYHEMQDVSKVMTQFKEDFKDHLTQSQHPAVVASMTIYTKVTSESNTARAIKEMRSRIPGFSIYELERDAKGVFCQIYEAFLEGNLSFIEKTCGESALVYFKTLLKKREVDGVYPKYTYLWDADTADLIGGKIPAERNQPTFTFTIRVQEIHCNISKKTRKVVDGREDKVMQQRFNFVLVLHENPDLEISGHPWEIIEILPVEAVHMLA